MQTRDKIIRTNTAVVMKYLKCDKYNDTIYTNVSVCATSFFLTWAGRRIQRLSCLLSTRQVKGRLAAQIGDQLPVKQAR